jgi:hypothetical protein
VSDAIQPEESQSALRRWRLPLAAAALLLIAAVLFGLDAGGVRGKILHGSSTSPKPSAQSSLDQIK